ncbi:alpha/beta-hydrolase [Clavulina sp. PMI_390]|nr:alpha/beta-hydrolase [Clavulina sp. PMI_390]
MASAFFKSACLSLSLRCCLLLTFSASLFPYLYGPEHLLRRSFAIISLSIGGFQTLNHVLAPFTFDSKGKQRQALASGSSSSSAPYADHSNASPGADRAKPSIDLGGPDSAALYAVIPDHPSSLLVRKGCSSKLLPSEKDPMRDGDGDDPVVLTESVSLHDFVRKHVTSLFEKWEPTWWLNSGHFQTFWSSAGNFSELDQIEYDRTLLELPDGGVVAVDFTFPRDGSISDETPIVIVLPGLTGGSQASYVRMLVAQTGKSRAEGGLGLRSVVLNSRGCGNVPLRTPQISAGSPNDLKSALIFLREKYPAAPIYGVGFSLGATVLSKYLGQEGDASEIQAAVVVACPWDLQRNSDQLEREFIGKHVYSRALAKSYLALLHRSLPTLEVDSSHVFHSHLEIIHTLRSPTFTKVNTHMAAIIGGPSPDFPHPSVNDFYRWASCARDIPGVSVPLLIINADDDPIVQVLPEDEVRAQRGGKNGGGSTMMVVTRGGGHLGWFHGKDAKRRWISTPIMQWLRAVSEEIVWGPDDPGYIGGAGADAQTVTGDFQVVAEPSKRKRRVRVVCEDGFTRAEGEPLEIGYRLFDDEDFGFVDTTPAGGETGANGDSSVPGAFAGL